MRFHEFAQLLHPLIGGGSSTYVFVRTLFDAIITEDGRAALEEVGEESYKAYYNGNTGISRFAKKINAYVEPAEFEAYCNELSDAAVAAICERFRVYLPEINPYNAAELLANLFRDIINEAAFAKRKNNPNGKDRGVVADDVQNDDALQPEVELFDAEPALNASGDTKITVIQHQINVVQNGENNFNLTNNGTMSFSF